MLWWIVATVAAFVLLLVIGCFSSGSGKKGSKEFSKHITDPFLYSSDPDDHYNRPTSNHW